MTKQRKHSIHGGGSVYQRKNDGRWVARIINPATGRRVQRYASTEKEANELLNKMKHEIRQNELVSGPRQTVEKYLLDWFDTIHVLEVRNTTYLRQELILRRNILPALGHIQLRDLTAEHVQRLYTQKIKDGWKPTTLRNIHKILHKALRNAVRRRLVPYNVCDLVTLPRQSKRKTQVLTKEQVIQLLKVARGHQMEPLIVLGLGLGMRHGEIGALRWQDIDFAAHTLSVERSVSFISPQGYIVGAPKTENSERIIILPKFVMSFLLRHRNAQHVLRQAAGEQWQDQDLVFCGLTGGFRSPAANQKCIDRLLKRHGLPRLKVHELRHNAATLLAARMNMPANVVQNLLGHEDIETTLGLYGHADLDMQRKMMADLDEFLGDLNQED